MTIAQVAASAAITTSTLATTPTMPTGNVGDMALAFVGWGIDNTQTAANFPTVSGITGWTHLLTVDSGAVGAESYGLDTGPRAISTYYKEMGTTTETAPTFTNAAIGTAGNRVITAMIVRYSKTTPAGWAPPVATGGVDANKADGWSTVGLTNIGAAVGDYIAWGVAIQPDTVNPTVALAWTGATLGTQSLILSAASTSGHDMRLNTRSVEVTAGASTAAPTLAAALTGAAGAAILVRLRENPHLPVVESQHIQRASTW